MRRRATGIHRTSAKHCLLFQWCMTKWLPRWSSMWSWSCVISAVVCRVAEMSARSPHGRQISALSLHILFYRSRLQAYNIGWVHCWIYLSTMTTTSLKNRLAFFLLICPTFVNTYFTNHKLRDSTVYTDAHFYHCASQLFHEKFTLFSLRITFVLNCVFFVHFLRCENQIISVVDKSRMWHLQCKWFMVSN